MSKEIERRFLVHSERLPKLVRGKKVIQAYLSSDPVVRIRIKGNKAYFTIKKSKNDVIREEYEYRIPLKDAKKLIKGNKKVEKTRYRFKLNGSFWEIDKFEAANKGLVVAEIELSKPDQKFQKPLWLSEEVTKDSRYLNVNLAEKPYLIWK
jgi:CYTH domain-containing protein